MNTNTTANFLGIGTTGTCIISSFNQWSSPKFIKSQEVGESIEFIYKQTSMFTYTTTGYLPPSEVRLFKIVFSCIDGKWNKSEPIYGKIISAQDEYYEFED